MLPRPEDQPTVALWPDAADAVGVGRASAYRAALDGTFPAQVIRCGRSIRVSTADLRRVLGLDVSDTK
jgi:predicted DNA-binding transcriptional regulator AlpA